MYSFYDNQVTTVVETPSEEDVSTAGTARLLTEDDFGQETGNPIVWNKVIIRPHGDFYLFAKPKAPTAKPLGCRVVAEGEARSKPWRPCLFRVVG